VFSEHGPSATNEVPVDDLEAAAAAIESNGGRIFRAREDVPGTGAQGSRATW